MAVQNLRATFRLPLELPARMRIRILGCGGGIGPGLRTTAILVDDDLLIDAGTGVGDLDGTELVSIRDVLLTHSHLDHVCGVAFMADNLFGEIDHPLRVHALPETLAVLREHLFNWKLWPDFTVLPTAERPMLEMRVLTPGQPLVFGTRRVTAFRVAHTVPAVGYVVECGSGVFAFSGDTHGSDHIGEALNALPRLDHLMIEVAFPNRDAELAERSRHFTAASLAAELARLRHRPMLHLTHAKPGCEGCVERECAEALAGWQYRHLRTGDEIRL